MAPTARLAFAPAPSAEDAAGAVVATAEAPVGADESVEDGDAVGEVKATNLALGSANRIAFEALGC